MVGVAVTYGISGIMAQPAMCGVLCAGCVLGSAGFPVCKSTVQVCHLERPKLALSTDDCDRAKVVSCFLMSSPWVL
jgi:hypothetical protein